MPKRRIVVKTNSYTVVSDALHDAVARGMNKADKYCEEQLTDSQRALLAEHIVNYFWCALEEAGAEIV